jgi:PAS domain-containing protein
VDAPSPRRSDLERVGTTAQQPVALLFGRGHRIVHANPAFVAEFGAGCVGLPASEALTAWPHRVFSIVDRVLQDGRPLATFVEIGGRRRRLTVAPRRDPEDGEVYGVALRLADATPGSSTAS